MATTKTPVLDELLTDVARLKEAEALLEQIYQEVGAYQNGEITAATWERVKNFYDFDDGE